MSSPSDNFFLEIRPYLFMSKALGGFQFSCEHVTSPETPSSSGLCLILSVPHLFQNGYGAKEMSWSERLYLCVMSLK